MITPIEVFVGIFLLVLGAEIIETVRYIRKGIKIQDLTYWWWAIGFTLFILIILFNFK